jgi:hypothetical protein
MLGLVLVSHNINQSSRRSASAGWLKFVKPRQLRALYTKMKIKFLPRNKMENATSSAAGRPRRYAAQEQTKAAARWFA